MHANWLKMQPVITLEDVNIWSQDKQKTLMQIPQVNVRVNLFLSLLHRKAEISLLQITLLQTTRNLLQTTSSPQSNTREEKIHVGVKSNENTT